MFRFFDVLCSFGLLTLAAAISPGKNVAVEQDSMSNLRLLKNLTFPKDGLPPNFAQLHDKLPKGLLGFLRKEDKQHMHAHTGTKEQHAKHRANFTLELLRLFRPCATCGQYERFGSAHDGGYVMCGDLMAGVKAIYSFGIEGNDDWGAAVSKKTMAPVYQFDCYNTGAACPTGQTCANVHFFPECLGLSPESSTQTFRSLRDHLQRHTPLRGRPLPRGGDLILKVDIEGKEWNTFADARIHDLQRMRQIVVEFHGISHDEFHDSYLQALRRIHKAGFIVAHIHGNNYGSMALFGDGRFKLADHVEVTFVNKQALPPAFDMTCRSTQKKLGADSVGNPYFFDLPEPVLPGVNDTIMPSHIRVVTCRWWCSVYARALAIGPFYLGSGFMLTWIVVLVLLLSGPSVDQMVSSFTFGKGHAEEKRRSTPCSSHEASEVEGDDI